MQVTTQVQSTIEIVAETLHDCKSALEELSCDTQGTKELAQTIESLAYDADSLAEQYKDMQGLVDLFNKSGWELELRLYQSEYSYSIWVKDYPACKIEGLVKGIPTFGKLKDIVDDARWSKDALDFMVKWMSQLCDDYDLNSLDVEAIKQAAIEMDAKLPCLWTDLDMRKGGIPCR